MANRILLNIAPASIEDLRQAMQSHYHELSPRLQQIADLLMRDPQAVATYASRDLAIELGVPQSTLTRFAKVMGYSTFKEIQAQCKAQYIELPRNYLDRLKRAQSPEDNTQAPHELHLDFAQAVQQSLQMTALELSAEKLDAAANLLQNASEVWIHGIRRAYPVATYLHYLLLKIGIRASLLDDSGGLLEPSLCRLHNKGVLVIITYSPHATETEKVIAFAQQQGISTIALSDPVPSSHAKGIDLIFEIREGEVMGFRSLSTSMYVAQALAVQVAKSMLSTKKL